MCQDVSSSYPGNTLQRDVFRAPCFCRSGGALRTHTHTHTIRRMFIFGRPNADCIFTDLISVEKMWRNFCQVWDITAERSAEISGVGGKLNLFPGLTDRKTEVAWLQPLCTLVFDDNYTSCCLPGSINISWAPIMALERLKDFPRPIAENNGDISVSGVLLRLLHNTNDFLCWHLWLSALTLGHFRNLVACSSLHMEPVES